MDKSKCDFFLSKKTKKDICLFYRMRQNMMLGHLLGKVEKMNDLMHCNMKIGKWDLCH